MSSSKRFGIFEVSASMGGGFDSLHMFTSEHDELDKIISEIEKNHEIKEKHINVVGATIKFSKPKGGLLASPVANAEVKILLLNNGWEPYFKSSDTSTYSSNHSISFKKQFD